MPNSIASPSNKRGHFRIGERGHYRFGLTPVGDFLANDVADLGRCWKQNPRLGAFTSRFPGAFRIEELRLFGIVAIEDFEVSRDLAAIPDVSVHILSEPIIGGLDHDIVLGRNIRDHRTGDSVDEFCVAGHRDGDGLGDCFPVVIDERSFVLPPVAGNQRQIRIGGDRAADLCRIDELGCKERTERRLVDRVVQRLAQIQSRFEDLGTLFAAIVVLHFGITAADGIRNGGIQALGCT